MKKDVGWKSFFEDNRRYADMINGAACGGMQYVKPDDLQEVDSASKGKARDLVRKTAFGVNFALIGIENQEVVDYKFPLRNLHYEVNQYEKQAAEIRRKVKDLKSKPQSDASGSNELMPGEYLYGFLKESKLYPVVTLVLYSGKDPWDGPKCLHDILDFTDIPEAIRKMTADYAINLIDIRRLEDTSVFQTDVRYVFDFIRCAEDKQALLKLVNSEPYYREMDEDAFEVVSMYTNSKELVGMQAYEVNGGKKDVCKAIRDLMEDSRLVGQQEGRKQGIEQNKIENARNLLGILSDEVIAEKIGLSLERVEELRAEATLSK